MTNNTLTPKKFKKLIDGFQSVAIGIHSLPDGDCIGAGLGVGYFLEDQDKDVKYFSPTKPSDQLLKMKGVEKFQTEGFIPEQYDLIIIVDTANQDRSILADHKLSSLKTPVIIIDHHADNNFETQYIHTKHVENKTSSCCEIIYKLIADQPDAITPHIATALLLGIITDTGRFQRGVNISQSMAIASDLIDKKADYEGIIKKIYTSASFDEIKFHSTIMERMQYSKENTIIRTYILQSELETKNLDSGNISNAYTSILSIQHGGIFVFFKIVDSEDDKAIKISFRTRYSPINVSRIAHHFGGGGHTAASGAKVTLETDRKAQLERIIQTVEKCIAEQEIEKK